MNSSAKLAGFFETDRTRLIRPSGAGDSAGSEGDNRNQEETKAVQQPIADSSVPLGELWVRLLNESANWSAEKTQEFVAKARELREVLARDS
jgi:hypothetical protein